MESSRNLSEEEIAINYLFRKECVVDHNRINTNFCVAHTVCMFLFSTESFVIISIEDRYSSGQR